MGFAIHYSGAQASIGFLSKTVVLVPEYTQQMALNFKQMKLPQLVATRCTEPAGAGQSDPFILSQYKQNL